jgi:hypothetical protein
LLRFSVVSDTSFCICTVRLLSPWGLRFQNSWNHPQYWISASQGGSFSYSVVSQSLTSVILKDSCRTSTDLLHILVYSSSW